MSTLLIIIPTYNQPLLATRCLHSLNSSSLNNLPLSIKLRDDNSSQNNWTAYENLLNKFPNLKISVDRQGKNQGALGNMIACLTAPEITDFIMVMHEDDYLHPQYLKTALSILENNPEIAFVASPARFFEPGEEVTVSTNLSSAWKKYSLKDFVSFILSGNRFAFGSVVYRRELIKAEQIDFKNYQAFFDRPFLLQILKDSSCFAAVTESAFYYYQNHPWPDKRWQELNFDHVFNLYNLYETLAPGRGRALSSQYFFDFANLKNRSSADWQNFWKRGRKAGLIGGRCSGKFLLAALFIIIFGQKSYQRLFNFLKSFK